MKDLNGAFPRTPERIEAAICEGIRRGRRREARRAYLRRFASAAAVLLVLMGAFALAFRRERTDPATAPGGGNVLAARLASATPAPSPAQSATPAPSPTALPTQAPTPEPTEQSSAESAPAPTLPAAIALPAAEADLAELLSQSREDYANVDISVDNDALDLDPLDMGACFSTDAGTWFHADPKCSGMTGAKARTLREALQLGQDFCPVCITFAQGVDDPAWSVEGDGYYHADAACAGVSDTVAQAEQALTFVERARMLGKLPCPDCVMGQYVTPAVLSGALYCTKGGVAVHSDPNCSGMLNADACTLSQALRMGKSVCGDCIGENCVYIDGAYWNPATEQLLLCVDVYAATHFENLTLGQYIDPAQMQAVESGLNSWDSAVLAAFSQTAYYQVFMESGVALRMDARELSVSLSAGDGLASTEWTDEGGCHLRLLYECVTAGELDALELTVSACERFYRLGADGLYAQSAPTVEANVLPIGSELNYAFDDEGNCTSFTPGNLLAEYDWTQNNAVDISGGAHLSLYWLDVTGEDLAILEVRAPAGMDIAPALGEESFVSIGMHAEGDELVYTAILPGAQAQAILKDPALFGLAPAVA